MNEILKKNIIKNKDSYKIVPINNIFNDISIIGSMVEHVINVEEFKDIDKIQVYGCKLSKEKDGTVLLEDILLGEKITIKIDIRLKK